MESFVGREIHGEYGDGKGGLTAKVIEDIIVKYKKYGTYG